MGLIKRKHIYYRLLFGLVLGLGLLIYSLNQNIAIIRAQGSVADFQWPYNTGSDVTYSESDLTGAWDTWKSTTITSTNAGGNGRLRVMGGVNNSSSVSEGMAYGLLFASIFDDQATFDGLWRFTEDHFNSNGLMNWYIGNYGQYLGTGAATDAEADMVIALINACVKVDEGVWSASTYSIDYCQEATDMINAMWQYEVDQPGAGGNGLSNNQGYELLPGDTWGYSGYPDGIVNLSYFAPAYFEVYAKFTNNDGWYDVIDRQYEITNIVQAKSDNCSGLVPNWNTYQGDAQLVSWQPQNYEWWSYDAARFAQRIALDQVWYQRPEASETMTEIGSFFASAGFDAIGEQSMAGQTVSGGAYPFFIANATAAVYAAPQLNPVTCGIATGTIQESKQSAYDKALSSPQTPSDYYNDAWRLFSMLTMTGNFPNLYETAQSNNATPTPTPSATLTPVPTSTPVPTLTFGTGVSLFADEDYDAGGIFSFRDAGTYSALALGELNDNIESVQVPIGMSVMLCSDALGQDNCYVFNTDTSPLPAELINNVSFVQVNIQAPTSVGLSASSAQSSSFGIVVWVLLVLALSIVGLLIWVRFGVLQKSSN